MDYYTQEMVAGDFDKCFSIKRYLKGGAFGKVFTVKQRSHSKQVSLTFVTTEALAKGNICQCFIPSLYFPLQSESCYVPVMIM